MTILVYTDKGAGPRSVRLLIKTLKSLEIDKRFTLKRVNRHTIANENWERETRLLIFPGGQDIPYHQLLNGSPNKKIRDYVEKGGRYLGICAGGYYGSANIEFEKKHPLEVIAKRELRFFPGIARGAAYGPNRFKYEDESGSHAAELNWLGEESLETPLSIYFNGGCTFVNADNYSNTQVLARYTDLPETPAAIVECTVGKGKALLLGVHPEYSFTQIQTIASIPQKILNKLREGESGREKLFQLLINRSL